MALSDYELALRLQQEWDAQEAAEELADDVGGDEGHSSALVDAGLPGTGIILPARPSKKEEPIVIDSDSDEEAPKAAPARKRVARTKAEVDPDAELARQLQEQFDREASGLKVAAEGAAGPSRHGRTSDRVANAEHTSLRAVAINFEDNGYLGIHSTVASSIPDSPDLVRLLDSFSKDFKCPSCRSPQEHFGNIDAALVLSAPASLEETLDFLENACAQGICSSCSSRYCIACKEKLSDVDKGDSRAWADHCSLLRLFLVYAVLGRIGKSLQDNEEQGSRHAAEKSKGPATEEPATGRRGRGRDRRGRGSCVSTNGTGYASANYSRGGYESRSSNTGPSSNDKQLELQQKLDTELAELFDALIFFLPDSSLRASTPDLIPHELLPVLLRKSPLIDAITLLLRNDSFLEITGASDGWQAPPRPTYPYALSASSYAHLQAASNAPATPTGATSESGIKVKGRSKVYFKALELIRSMVDGHELLGPVVVQGYDSEVTKEGGDSSRKRKRGESKTENSEKETDHVPSILELLGFLLRQADVFVRGLSSAADDVLDEEKSTAALGLALELKTAGERIQASAVRVGDHPPQASNAPVSSATIQPKVPYQDLLRDLRFGHADLQIVVKKEQVAQYTNSAPNRGRTLRLAQETATLSTSLPEPSPSSSIFLRVDEDRMDRMRFVISGPEGTPYGMGLFLFDTSFGAGYPHDPPYVTLLTTGNGTVRFNPNLYNNGKVCLSLLNTWSGAPEEMWQPNNSTLFQVFLSIQTFILVPLPYFNEPGYGAPNASNAQSVRYNKNIRRQTVRWAMVDILRRPPAGFVEVVTKHFAWLHRAEADAPSAPPSGKGKNKVAKTWGRLLDTVIGWARDDVAWDGSSQDLYSGRPYYGPGGQALNPQAIAVQAAVPTEGEFAEFGVGWSKLLSELKVELDKLPVVQQK